MRLDSSRCCASDVLASESRFEWLRLLLPTLESSSVQTIVGLARVKRGRQAEWQHCSVLHGVLTAEAGECAAGAEGKGAYL